MFWCKFWFGNRDRMMKGKYMVCCQKVISGKIPINRRVQKRMLETWRNVRKYQIQIDLNGARKYEILTDRFSDILQNFFWLLTSHQCLSYFWMTLCNIRVMFPEANYVLDICVAAYLRCPGYFTAFSVSQYSFLILKKNSVCDFFVRSYRLYVSFGVSIWIWYTDPSGTKVVLVHKFS